MTGITTEIVHATVIMTETETVIVIDIDMDMIITSRTGITRLAIQVTPDTALIAAGLWRTALAEVAGDTWLTCHGS